MVTEAEIRTFVDGATHYFAIAANQPAAIGSPYLVTEGLPAVHEYSAHSRARGDSGSTTHWASTSSTAPARCTSSCTARRLCAALAITASRSLRYPAYGCDDGHCAASVAR